MILSGQQIESRIDDDIIIDPYDPKQRGPCPEAEVIFGPCNPRLSTEMSRPQRTVSQITTESPWDSHRVPPQVRNGLWNLS